jgi:hypothetical protein
LEWKHFAARLAGLSLAATVQTISYKAMLRESLPISNAGLAARSISGGSISDVIHHVMTTGNLAHVLRGWTGGGI